MTKENIKDQEINNETEFNEGEGRTACENDPCANVAEEQQETANVGDTVRIRETRPLSKMKRWELVEIIKH